MKSLYILKYREMHFVGKGDPDHYDYVTVAKSTDKQFINSLIEKYNLKMANLDEFIDDGYIIIEEYRKAKTEDFNRYGYVESFKAEVKNAT